MLITVESPVVNSKNMVVFTATGANQISSAYREKRHGLFTYYFLKGLHGEADSNQDGVVDVQEGSVPIRSVFDNNPDGIVQGVGSLSLYDATFNNAGQNGTWFDGDDLASGYSFQRGAVGDAVLVASPSGYTVDPVGTEQNMPQGPSAGGARAIALVLARSDASPAKGAGQDHAVGREPAAMGLRPHGAREHAAQQRRVFGVPAGQPLHQHLVERARVVRRLAHALAAAASSLATGWPTWRSTWAAPGCRSSAR